MQKSKFLDIIFDVNYFTNQPLKVFFDGKRWDQKRAKISHII